MEIQVRHRIPSTVEVVDVQLPFYFKVGKFAARFCCMTEEGKLIQVYSYGGYMHIDVSSYNDAHEIAEKMEREFTDEHYQPLEESIFHHKFSEAHRELFYYINPQLRPKL